MRLGITVNYMAVMLDSHYQADSGSDSPLLTFWGAFMVTDLKKIACPTILECERFTDPVLHLLMFYSR